MPKIKVYDAPIGVTGAIQTQRATADAFGGGAGMVAAGKAMFKFGEELQERTEKKEDLQYKADRAAINIKYAYNKKKAVRAFLLTLYLSI